MCGGGRGRLYRRERGVAREASASCVRHLFFNKFGTSFFLVSPLLVSLSLFGVIRRFLIDFQSCVGAFFLTLFTYKLRWQDVGWVGGGGVIKA